MKDPRFAPFAWNEEHFRALICLARNRGYSVRYADAMASIRSVIHDLAAKAVLSN